MKFVSVLLLLSMVMYAEKLEITADKFVAVDAENRVTFDGNAHIEQGATTVDAKQIVVSFDDSNSTKQYEATGNVRFHIVKKKSDYRGRCHKIVYLPKKASYILSGSVQVKDILNSRQIFGQRIEINIKTGNFTIKGAKSKPAKLIFEMR